MEGEVRREGEERHRSEGRAWGEERKRKERKKERNKEDEKKKWILRVILLILSGNSKNFDRRCIVYAGLDHLITHRSESEKEGGDNEEKREWGRLRGKEERERNGRGK